VLGLNEDTVLSDLHSAMAAPAPAGLTAIQIAAATAPGYSVPTNPRRRIAPGEIYLDPERLKQIGDSTKRVGEVLSQVFTEEDEAAEMGTPDQASAGSPVPAPQDEAPAAFDGLDPRYKGFLTELLSRASWPRSDLDLLARAHELMTDGALEALNEWAFDRHGDALVEDGDPVTIQQHLIGHVPPVEDVQSHPHQAP
jgi:hypothetical protein